MFPKALYVSRVSDNWSQLATDIKQDLMDPHFWALEGRKGMVQFAKAMVYEDRPAGRVLKIQFHWERAAELTREVMRLYTGRELLGNWQAVCGVMKALGRHTEELDNPVGTLAKATPTSRAPTSAALPTASAD
jgi:hypothetical protein